MAPSGERFHVRLASEDGGSSERVVVEVGLDGFNVLSEDGARTLRKYPLQNISRWSMRSSSLILFTRSPVRARIRIAAPDRLALSRDLAPRPRAAPLTPPAPPAGRH
jgi:hypothetical protein